MRKVDYVKSALDSNTFEVATPEELLRLAHSEANQRVLENYRMDLSLGKKDSPWKKLLMAIIPQAKRKDVNCPSHKAEDMEDTGLIFIDDDSDKLPVEIRYENFLNHLSELGISDMPHVALISASKKLHIVVPKIDQSLSVAENHDMWRRLLDGCGISMDPACKNLNRLMFVTGECLGGDLSLLFADTIPQVSPALAQHCHSEQREESRAVTSQESLRDPSSLRSVRMTRRDDSTVAGEDDSSAESYHGIPYEDIVAALVDEMGGESVLSTPGDRNNSVYRVSAELATITDCDPDWVATLLADYEYFTLPREEALSTIKSSCKAKKSSGTGRQSRLLRGIIKRLAVQSTESTDYSTTEGVEGDWSPFSEVPPAMPPMGQLPPFVRLLLSRTPSRCYELVLNGCIPGLATHLVGVTCKGIDGSILHLCGFLSAGVARMSAGKSALHRPLDSILSPLKLADNEARMKLDVYNDLARRSKSSDLPEKPKFESQLLGSDCTSAALISRLKDLSDDKSLILRGDELQMLTGLQSNVSGSPSPLPLILAYGREELTVERSTEQGMSGSVAVRLNVSVLGTQYQAQKFFAGGYHSGLISRFSFATIHDDESEFFYGDYTGFDELIAPYLELLKAEKGKHLECKKIDDWAKRMLTEILDLAAAHGSEALRNLSYRAVIIAQKRAYIYWLLNKKVFNKKLENFLTWTLRAQMHSMFFVLGDLIAKESAAEERASIERSPGPQNMLAMLTDCFTKTDLIELRKRMGMEVSNRAISRQLSAWRGRRLIADNADGSFTNLKR